jgi:hypothetical protein
MARIGSTSPASKQSHKEAPQMRSVKLVPALMATALLALVPAGASAAKHHRAKRHARAISAGACHLNINAAPRVVQAGEPALAFGQLTCGGGTSVEGQTVTVLKRSAPSSAVTTAGTATTDSTGHYQLTTPALLTNSGFFATALGARSGPRTVRVSPKVTVSGPPDGSQLFTGAGPFLHAHGLLSSKVTFSGSVNPADVGANVTLQRENTVGVEEWHVIGRPSKVKAGGAYSITHTFRVPGDANIRVVVAGSKRNAPGASEPLSYEISQQQNPALTIQSSADPIFYGQPVTISGTIAAGSTPLTLLARTPHGKPQPVDTVTSSSSGTYTFHVQSPLQSTLYQVTGAGKASARLFQGVKYGLTASVSASTVQAGQPLTFSGTVTPGHAGHAVYLQFQYPSGVGFYTVDVGRVTAGSTYSIAHEAYVSGTKKYRIKVPGDSQNQGVASSLFAIQVNPAPPGALKPEAPGNSTPPSEGHL